MPRREYTSYEEVVEDYGSGALHPGDLKPALAKALNAILQPVRDHFAADERAKKLLAQVRSCSSLSLPPIFPSDLELALAKVLIAILEPMR